MIEKEISQRSKARTYESSLYKPAVQHVKIQNGGQLCSSFQAEKRTIIIFVDAAKYRDCTEI